MRSFTLSIIVAIVPTVLAGFGNGWDNQASGAFITSFETHITMPKAPTPQQDLLVLWPALQSDKALMQPILGSYANPERLTGCSHAKNGQWCVFTYTLLLNPQKVEQGPNYLAVDQGTELDISIIHEASISGYTQTIKKGDQVVSKRSDKDVGQAHRAEFHVECQAQFSAQTPKHVYKNTKITFSAAVPDFKNTASKPGVEVDGFTTPDGGKTWKIKTLTINAGSCNPNSRRAIEFQG
jgi:hypothetical protein